MSWPRIKKIHRVCLVGTLSCLLLLYMILWHTESWYHHFHKKEIMMKHMRHTMFHNPLFYYQREYPLANIVPPSDSFLNYLDLPKRKYGITFTEITSANRETSYPLAPDFTFHVKYGENNVVLYEDFGPGCVFRIYFFPVLPTNVNVLHKLSSSDLKDSYLIFMVDGVKFKYSLQQLMEGKSNPFISPINTRHPHVASGMGSYTPFCYQTHMVITYFYTKAFPPNLFQLTINCTLQDTYCPVHIYSAVSRHKYPSGTHVRSYADSSIQEFIHENVEQAAAVLASPETHGPDSGEACHLACVEICKSCERTVFQAERPGVIIAIKARLFHSVSMFLLQDWTQVLVSMYWDGATEAQVNRVPLGCFFGATGSLNDIKGAAAGLRQKQCSYESPSWSFPTKTSTGYLYFPMPFWRSARIVIEGAKSLSKPVVFCIQLTTIENLYQEEETGYFHGLKKYYTDQVDGWRQILRLENSWGHIVAVSMDTDDLKARRDVPLNGRWAALQADPILRLDGNKGASMLGTGLEDFFSYAHGFALAENTSYSFVGVHHAGPRRSEPLTWHCYRQHILDPIPFRYSVDFFMEGTHESRFHKPEDPISYNEHWNRKQRKEASLSHMVLFYAKEAPAMTLNDEVVFGNVLSEEEHGLQVQQIQGKTGILYFRQKRYLGASNVNQVHNKTGRSFSPGDHFQFLLRIRAPNKGIILRRDFYSRPAAWNEQAQVCVNGHHCQSWFIPMGTLSQEYSLRQEDLVLSAEVTSHLDSVLIYIEPITDWVDLGYQVYSIH